MWIFFRSPIFFWLFSTRTHAWYFSKLIKFVNCKAWNVKRIKLRSYHLLMPQKAFKQSPWYKFFCSEIFFRISTIEINRKYFNWSVNWLNSFFISRIVDSLKGKMKRTLSIIMVLGFGCWVWMCLICLKVIPFSLRKFDRHN